MQMWWTYLRRGKRGKIMAIQNDPLPTAASWAPVSAFIILPGRPPCANERSDYSKWYRRQIPPADRQGAPDRRTKDAVLRSSTRATPRGLSGSIGSMADHS